MSGEQDGAERGAQPRCLSLSPITLITKSLLEETEQNLLHSCSLECTTYIDGEFTKVLNICQSWQAYSFFLNKEIKGSLSQVIKIVTTTRESEADFWTVSDVKFLLSCCKSHHNFICCRFCIFFCQRLHSWNFKQVFVVSMRWQCACDISLLQLQNQDLLYKCLVCFK